ncbi:MAG: desulfoferrodoxin [candidate division Zixibacteria bacterium]|nr:desulfoferrodoxin [candidate division Zixibacteria bacterium]
MATEILQVYRCEKCGNIVEVIHAAGGTLVCCGQDMKLLKEGETDAATEKHVPVIEKIDGGYKVKVGDVAHPMEDKHYIEWIELIADGKAYRQFLNPSDKPEAVFMIGAENVSAREYCNLHGLWKA